MKRKLTTILCADVAGYSRLMGGDEEGTHRRLVALFSELIEPAIAARGGTLVKKTGDGLLAEFASVVEAMRCAIGIQQGLAEREARHMPDQNIALRIGINLGDVIIEADDIFGDGVNVAARLEALAEPGGIVVSRSVHDHVHEKVEIRFEDIGEQRLKNIARPVRAYRVRGAAGLVPASGNIGRRRWRYGVVAIAAGLGVSVIGGSWWFDAIVSLSNVSPLVRAIFLPQTVTAPSGPQLSIVVLPFVNLRNDPQQDYFVDGITENLTTDLSRALPGSFVVARGTAFTYRGKQIDPRQVGRDLNVRYLLEGSVIAEGDQVRVNAQLIDAETSTSMWAERFDTKRQNVFEIQDRIVGRLSRAVGLELVDIEARRSEREHRSNPTAVDFVMRGQAIANRPASPQTMIAARLQFQRAIEFDPDNVDALAGLAATYVFEVLNSYYEEGRAERLRNAKALIGHALALEPRHIVALKIHAALFRADGEFDDAIAASQVVIAQNPGEPWAYKEVGLSKLYLGQFNEAPGWFEKANQIGPRDPSRWIWLGAMGRVQFILGDDGEAIRLMRLSADANPNDPRAYALLAAIYAASGRRDEAAAALASCFRLRPEMTIKRLFADWSVPLQATSPAYRREHERFRDGLRLAGMPEE